MKLVKLSMVAAATCLLTTSAYALKTEDRVLKGNYDVEYTKTPGSVESFNEMFTKGEVYGRLRSNMFYWDWEAEDPSKAVDNSAWGLGGSLVYKTANYLGFSSTIGFYATFPLTNEEILRPSLKTGVKAGKDTFKTETDGSQSAMNVLAEATIEYKIGNTQLVAGRQKIETQLVSTNDTKMIPQTFEGVTIKNKDLPQTKLELGYLTKQKLRDHDEFHSIIAVGDTDAAALSYNDDYGRHQGLKVAKIKAAGEDLNPEMIYAMAENSSIPNLKLNAGYYGIDGYLKDVILEANYKIALDGGWNVTPGVRYFKQLDDGAGAIGGAAIGGTVTAANAASKGYKDGDNLDGSILMARLVAENGPFNAAVGWSKTSDDADIVAAWRYFPTWGYTRLMAQLDWIANTESYMAKVGYNFGKAGIVEGLDTVLAYQIIDFDDKKVLGGGTTWSDRDVITFDATKTFKELPNTEFKLRVGIIDAENPLGTIHADHVSYNEYRFEINYLF